MRIKINAVIGVVFSVLMSQAHADDISIKIESLSNIAQNGAIEACGTAIHKTGIKPVLVTLKHDESYYTTLTATNDKWCVLFKRWTLGGKIQVSASVLGSANEMGRIETEVN